MGSISIDDYTNGAESNHDRMKELKILDDTKLGVKGLVDAGAESIPKIFIRPPDELSEELNTPIVNLEVPVINLGDVGRNNCNDEIVKQVLYASEKWGFFQVINHGVPLEVMDKMLQGNQMFHEQNAEAKKVFYSRDVTKPVVYNTNYDLYTSRAANWRDSLAFSNVHTATGQLQPEDLPEICRDATLDYINHVMKLGEILLELLSAALGLRPGYLKEEMECNKGWSIVNHYYPACPAPELTLGTSKHSDPGFLTILLQDQIGGLQVLHENQWVDVQPIPGSFVVNIGDMLQVLSNDKVKSVYHRVTANQVGPRLSTALFLKGNKSSTKLCGPIKELLSEENPPVYGEFILNDYFTHFFSRPLNEPGLEYYKITKSR